MLNKSDLIEALPSQYIADGIGYEEVVRRYKRENLIAIFRYSILRGEGYKEDIGLILIL